MKRLTLAPAPMNDPPATPSRQAYEATLVRAMVCAARLVSRDEAFEISHDVAVEMMGRPAASVTPVLIYIAVTNRVRKLWRAAQRRATTDAVYLEMQSGTTPAWAEPGSDLEAGELRERIVAVISEMPAAMREAFLLVRHEGLSYKEAAARLQVAVGTVHTQLSRANALLRDCVQRYRAGAAESFPSHIRTRRHEK